MTYVKWRDADGYESGCRECLDLSALAADLCKALDGKAISTDDRNGYVTFELVDGCKVSLSNGWRSNEVDKATVHIDPPDELDSLRGYDLLNRVQAADFGHRVGQTAARRDRC